MRVAHLLPLAAALLLIAGCSKPAAEGNPYAEAKRSWDTPPSAQTESQLRERVITSQRDR